MLLKEACTELDMCQLGKKGTFDEYSTSRADKLYLKTISSCCSRFGHDYVWKPARRRKPEVLILTEFQ